MAALSGTVQVGPGKAEKICTLGEEGALLSVSGGAIWIGTAAVAQGSGVKVPATDGSLPLFIPGPKSVITGFETIANLAQTADLYAVADNTSVAVSFFTPRGG